MFSHFVDIFSLPAINTCISCMKLCAVNRFTVPAIEQHMHEKLCVVNRLAVLATEQHMHDNLCVVNRFTVLATEHLSVAKHGRLI